MNHASDRVIPIPWLATNYSVVTRDITPKEAEAILAHHNTKNRRVYPGKVAQWRRAIERNDWKVNGETITFDKDAILMDGQHRLMACRDSGIAIRCIVVMGLDPVARPTINRGLTRSIGDVLHFMGMENSILMAATVRALQRIRGASRDGSGAKARFAEWCDSADPEHVAKIASAEAERIRRALLAVRGLSTKWIAQSSAAALHVEFAIEASPESADAFWEAVRTGASLDADDPRLVLRNRLHVACEARRTGRTDKGGVGASILSRADLRERLCIYAWNRWITGTAAVIRNGVALIQLGKRDAVHGPFPTIEGPSR